MSPEFLITSSKFKNYQFLVKNDILELKTKRQTLAGLAGCWDTLAGDIIINCKRTVKLQSLQYLSKFLSQPTKQNGKKKVCCGFLLFFVDLYL